MSRPACHSCEKTAFEIVEVDVPPKRLRTYVILCVKCGSIVGYHETHCWHLRLSKLAHKLGFDLEK